MTTKLKTYSKYKNSGFEWINTIPYDWSHDKIVSLFDFPNDKVSDIDFEPLSVTYGGVKKQVDDAAKTDNGSNRRLLKIGDIAFNGRSDRRGACGVSEFEGSISVVYHVLRKRSSNIDVRFFHHLFRNTLFSQEFYRWGRGIHDDMWTTRTLEMKRIHVPIPPLGIQKNIADFLDEKIMLIDDLVQKKEKLIELLREKHQSLVSQVITKGLDSKVKMKPSGIEWLGNVPSNWEIVSFKQLFKVSREKVVDDVSVNTILAVSGYRGVEPKDIRSMEGQMPSEDISNYRIVRKGQLAVNTMWLNHTGLGVSDYEGYISPAYRSYNINENVDRKFIHHLLRSGPYIQKYSSMLYGLRPNSLQVKEYDFERIEILLPPIETQKKIAVYLDNQTVKINDIISLLGKQLNELKEYRLSFVYSAVTGKIKV